MTKLSFKYYSAGPKEGFEYLERLLLEGELWFPAARAFNDPNEFRCQLRAPKRKSIIQKQYLVDNPEASLEDFESWYRTVSWKSWHLYLEPAIQRDLSRLGVLCLSRTCRNPIMWAHYADKHTGVCIAFNSDFAQLDNLILTDSVLYRKRLPKVKYFGEDQTDVIKKLLLTKYDGWSYEKELRVITSEGNITKQISPMSIDGIILGMNISHENEGHILEIIGKRESPIKVLRAHLSYSTYEMGISNRLSNEPSSSSASSDYR